MSLSVQLGALAFLLLCVSRHVGGEAEEIGVEISSRIVTLICPGEKSQWEKKTDSPFLNPGNGNSLLASSPDALNKLEEGGEFFCKTSKNLRLKIYLKIRVCEDCVELSFGLGASIVVADLLLTLGVLFLVYFCCKQQPTFFRAGTPGRQQGQQADGPPPVPNPDYEPIRKGQREVYAGLEPRAF
ncbi:T-cell surface glycoprotein CD3 epsilon chain [Candoia aspera]|uniref:T-cell surface glycoprotein CD3 epsilon chain n=1 Tax=Candoia aspera TaxID=51853 RepID=UPI002FD7D8EE